MKTTAPLPNRIWAFGFHIIRSLPWRPKFFLGLAVVAASVAKCLYIGMMYTSKLLIDGILKSPEHNLWPVAFKPFLIIAACGVSFAIIQRIKSLSDGYSTPELVNKSRDMLMQNLMEHSQSYFHNRFSGALVSKINNISSGYRTLISSVFLNGFISTFMASAASSFVLWTINPRLVGVVWGGVTIIFLFVRMASKPVGKASAILAEKEAQVTGQVVDTVTNISSVKNFGHSSYELVLLQKKEKPYIQGYRDLSWKQTFLWGGFDFLITVLILGFVWQIIDGWYEYHMTPGDIAITLAIGWDLWGHLARFSGILSDLSNETSRIQEAIDEIVQPVEIVDQQAAKDLIVTHGDVVFKDIAFAYPNGRQVFQNLNLHISASQRVGLVGLSGAGKTTLCQLLLRNYDIQQGQITIDGQDIKAVTQQSLRAAIAVIPQDPALFHRSLKENIAYGAPQASDEQIIAAAKAAQAHDFIIETPHHYETYVGERGVKLSGGQRQRIVIARAILKNAPVLLLDEATSALDSQTERAIQAAFHTAMEGRTTVVVAHRLSTLAHLDRLIVIHEGKVVEDGTLSELLAHNGHFATLWRMQADGFLPEKI